MILDVWFQNKTHKKTLENTNALQNILSPKQLRYQTKSDFKLSNLNNLKLFEIIQIIQDEKILNF